MQLSFSARKQSRHVHAVLTSPVCRVLVLIGAQGAGKSTFAQALIQGARLRWHRVNQDTISRRELLPPELEGWDIATGCAAAAAGGHAASR